MPWLRVAIILTCLFLSSANAAEFSITPVKDNIFKFSNGTHHAVFVVTDEGIALTDPLSTEGAKWLKQALNERFDKPVRYVIYSHNHPDHVYGGEIFAEPGVTFVAHAWARDDLLATKADTQIPDLVFNDEMQLFLGDTQIVLRYHGPNNGKGSISINFPSQRVVHVVDWIVLGRMPYKNLPGYDIRGMINSTRDVLAMDFDLLVGGHGDIGDKNDVRFYLRYLEQLYAAVLDGMREGKNLKTLQQDIRLDAFRSLKMYEAWLPLNVEGVYNDLIDQSYLHLRPEVPVSER
ncbi:MBL fold metallo-hydrolase [Methylophaga sp.]|uniref:MBL fold metallo-hydrolase n=1 Tax=Methylophaga sp. TaxID=2024840 RepID=UPI00140089E4|nr:MBL fold metallo-hydrolase [Methylophaga sp.]MTI63940.1 MBL fold metallo-hydrolase [Methylophaga sp.]